MSPLVQLAAAIIPTVLKNREEMKRNVTDPQTAVSAIAAASTVYAVQEFSSEHDMIIAVLGTIISTYFFFNPKADT
jgi:hypothetical protein